MTLDRPAPAVHRDLAYALKQQATRAGESSPSVRGSDWRLATVTLVNADGTVTAQGIPSIRCLDTYRSPAVDDLIVISQSSNGNWLAHGRLAATTRDWETLPLSSGWAVLSGYYTPAYRIWDDGTASLCGLASMSGSLPSGTVVATLPAEARPAAQCRFAVQVVLGFYGVMTLYPDGRVTLADFSGTLSSTGQKWAEFDVASHYRLT
ncbi:hypothetical protein ACIRP5_11040 [Streptomyces sp. NPDC101221]|uniref:hypothetical protein n=1 Tax=Streptomyces sp. NPDC101221 TaxID=3366132 RepID=UPI0038140D91